MFLILFQERSRINEKKPADGWFLWVSEDNSAQGFLIDIETASIESFLVLDNNVVCSFESFGWDGKVAKDGLQEGLEIFDFRKACSA